MRKLLILTATLFFMGTVMEMNAQNQTGTQKILIAYFSWPSADGIDAVSGASRNVASIAGRIQRTIGENRQAVDVLEIQCIRPYSTNYNTCLDEALRDQRANARPALKTHVSNIAQYDVVMLGYPNWWASIPAPIASFLEEYELSGKTIIPFCSHGGGRFGQSLTAIAKLEPRAKIGDALSVHYSGGNSLANDITAWLRKNGIIER